MKLDTLTLVETPEGIDLQAELVGLVPRALAYVVDFLIRLAVLIVFAIVSSLLGKAGSGLYLIVFFILEWWYPVLFEVYRGGQTWGKKLFNIKVVNDDLTPVKFSASLIRNLLRTADFFPLFYVFGIISVVVSRRFQRLGDLAAGTVVVYSKRESKETVLLENVVVVSPSHSLTEEQQMAFMNFALNRNNISQDRQNEIAEIIRPCLPNNVEDSTAYVRGVGKWLLGAR